MNRPVHPAALMAVGVFLGWAIAQPMYQPSSHTFTTESCQLGQIQAMTSKFKDSLFTARSLTFNGN